jgi:hypothetical protein
MDPLCPACGGPLISPDESCPRCALARAIAPVTPTVPVGVDRRPSFERRMPAGDDRDVRRSLRLLLAIGVGLTLLLFAVVAILVWVLFGV